MNFNTTFFIICLLGWNLSAAFAEVRGNGNIVERLDTLKQYNTIRISGKFEVNLHYDPVNPHLLINIDSNLIETVKVSQIGKIVLVTAKKNNVPTKMTIDVYTDKYQSINLDNVLSVAAESSLREDRLKFTMKGNGPCTLDIAAEVLNVNYKGNGELQFSGRSSSSSFSVKGGGTIKAVEVQAADIKASVNGSGNIFISASDKVKASVEGSGIIYYEGTPYVLDIHTKGSGQVISVDRCGSKIEKKM